MQSIKKHDSLTNFGAMKKAASQKNKGLLLLANAIYALLYIPFSVIALINYLIAPLAPSASFSELESK